MNPVALLLQFNNLCLTGCSDNYLTRVFPCRLRHRDLLSRLATGVSKPLNIQPKLIATGR